MTNQSVFDSCSTQKTADLAHAQTVKILGCMHRPEFTAETELEHWLGLSSHLDLAFSNYIVVWCGVVW